MECIKPYILCGGTALAMQIGHRKSEDLDFMMWRISKTEKPEVNWNLIEKELTEKIGPIENFNMLGFDQVEFRVKGVKFSFFVSDNYSPISNPVDYMGNIRLADIESIMAMKMEVMLRRMKFRDYYDIYSIIKEDTPSMTALRKPVSTPASACLRRISLLCFFPVSLFQTKTSPLSNRSTILIRKGSGIISFRSSKSNTTMT